MGWSGSQHRLQNQTSLESGSETSRAVWPWANSPTLSEPTSVIEWLIALCVKHLEPSPGQVPGYSVLWSVQKLIEKLGRILSPGDAGSGLSLTDHWPLLGLLVLKKTKSWK